MSDPRVRKYKSLVSEVNEVLYRDWAPIGFVDLLPKDEYESYAVRVVSMLASDADDDEIAKYLATTAAGLSGRPVSIDSALSIVQRLLSFRESARAIAL